MRTIDDTLPFFIPRKENLSKDRIFYRDAFGDTLVPIGEVTGSILATHTLTGEQKQEILRTLQALAKENKGE